MAGKPDMKLIEASLAEIKTIRDADAETTDYDVYDGLMFALWSGFGSAHREVLKQLLTKPTWDGDICSKSARDDLIDWGLATRCCFNFEQGFTTATYLAGSVWRVIKEGK